MAQNQQVHMGQMTNGETHKEEFPALGGQGKDVSWRRVGSSRGSVVTDGIRPLSAKSIDQVDDFSTSQPDQHLASLVILATIPHL